MFPFDGSAVRVGAGRTRITPTAWLAAFAAAGRPNGIRGRGIIPQTSHSQDAAVRHPCYRSTLP
jgi:hypothetical protein